MDNVKYIMKAKYTGSSAYGKANKYIKIEFNDMPTVHAWISMNKEKEWMVGFGDMAFGRLAHVVVTRREIIETVELEKDYGE